jgi:hypothetical protein
VFGQLLRPWWRFHGEHPLLTTFWPQDYRRGSDYELHGRRYRITRYVRALGNPRFFEVWGKEVPAPRSHSTSRRSRIYEVRTGHGAGLTIDTWKTRGALT